MLRVYTFIVAEYQGCQIAQYSPHRFFVWKIHLIYKKMNIEICGSIDQIPRQDLSLISFLDIINFRSIDLRNCFYCSLKFLFKPVTTNLSCRSGPYHIYPFSDRNVKEPLLPRLKMTKKYISDSATALNELSLTKQLKIKVEIIYHGHFLLLRTYIHSSMDVIDYLRE